MKKCIDCSEEKEDWEFESSIDKETGRMKMRRYCRECRNERQRKCGREKDLYRWYGITIKQYELMAKKQKEVCAICSQPETLKRYDKITHLAVDHCHKTGSVRGLLCNNCNRAIGLLKNNPKLLRKAAKYLEKEQT